LLLAVAVVVVVEVQVAAQEKLLTSQVVAVGVAALDLMGVVGVVVAPPQQRQHTSRLRVPPVWQGLLQLGEAEALEGFPHQQWVGQAVQAVAVEQQGLPAEHRLLRDFPHHLLLAPVVVVAPLETILWETHS
jgi:hypothetical protein